MREGSSGLRHRPAGYTASVSLFEPIFAALNEARVRYVVVGGLATLLHGFARLTADVDLVVDLEPQEAGKAIRALLALGFVARAPVDPMGFADPVLRRMWMTEKGMQVFTMVDRANPMRAVDVFVTAPIPFEDLWARAETVTLSGAAVRIAAIADLIDMKRAVGRPQDLIDVEALEQIRRRRDTDGGRT
jgi:sugar/nucleoside kinase (ribokinase family)